MINALEPYSSYEDSFDPLKLLSEEPNPDRTIKGMILNMIVPEAFHGEVYNDIGDYFTYCISTNSPKRIGSMKYKAKSC